MTPKNLLQKRQLVFYTNKSPFCPVKRAKIMTKGLLAIHLNVFIILFNLNAFSLFYE